MKSRNDCNQEVAFLEHALIHNISYYINSISIVGNELQMHRLNEFTSMATNFIQDKRVSSSKTIRRTIRVGHKETNLQTLVLDGNTTKDLSSFSTDAWTTTKSSLFVSSKRWDVTGRKQRCHSSP